MKLPDGVDLTRLREAVRQSRSDLQVFRREKADAIKQYVGYHYSKGGTTAQVPVNLLGMYISIMSRALVAKEPRVMLSTFDDEMRPAVDQMQQWLNEDVERTGLANTLRRWVIDALFSVGILKVALASPERLTTTDAEVLVGEPLCSVVSLDDFIVDLHAREASEVSFIGHRYRVPLDVANKLFKTAKDDKLHASDSDDLNSEGDMRANVIGRGDGGSLKQYKDYVDLWEIYLPLDGQIIVTLRDDGGLPGDEKSGKPLRVQKWVGPYCGPYHLLGFGLVPDNLMPKSPTMDLIDLHMATNRTYRKLVEQVDRFKSLLPVRGAAMDEGNRVKQASDGDIIQADNAGDMKEVAFGGPSQLLQLFVQDLQSKFDFVGGNLALLGGRGPQSRTASQDKMLNENASTGVADMQGTVVAGVSDVMKAVCWFHWMHPQKVMRTSKQIPGTDDSIPRNLHPYNPDAENFPSLVAQGATMRRGPMPNLRVDPYSLTHKTPQERLGFFTSTLTQLTPYLQSMQQQNIMVDFNALLEILSKLGDEPELKKVFKYQEPVTPDQETPPADGAAGKSPVSDRTYTRVSVGQGSQAAQGQSMMAQLMKGAANSNGDGG